MSEPQQEFVEDGTAFLQDDSSTELQQQPTSHASGFLQRHVVKMVLCAAALIACIGVVGDRRGAAKFVGFNTAAIIMKAEDEIECPEGFVKTHLDMENHDADMKERTESIEDCAKDCADDEECKGFEYNEAAQHCWISHCGHHCENKQHEGWISCVKGDKDECDPDHDHDEHDHDHDGDDKDDEDKDDEDKDDDDEDDDDTDDKEDDDKEDDDKEDDDKAEDDSPEEKKD